MPRDVAVQQPGARVLGFESDGDVSGTGEEGYVSTGRVPVVELAVCEVGFVERDGLLGENYEVMAVEMDLGAHKLMRC